VNELRIEWDPVAGAASYNIYKSSDGIAYSSLAIGVTDTFYVDPIGTVDDYYKVACVDSLGGEGDLSDPIQGYDPADICFVRGSIVDLNGDPASELVEVTYYVSTEDLPRFAQGSLITRRDMIVQPDHRGIFEIPVVKLSMVTLQIKGCGYQAKFQCPDQTILELVNIASIGVVERPTDYQF